MRSDDVRHLLSSLAGSASAICFVVGFSGGSGWFTAAIVLFVAWILLKPYGWLAALFGIFGR